MDAPCEIQGSIHVFRLVNNMCPGKWVHITCLALFFNPLPPAPSLGGVGQILHSSIDNTAALVSESMNIEFHR